MTKMFGINPISTNEIGKILIYLFRIGWAN